MGYERRARSFSFMGVVPIGQTVEVVSDEEEVPAVLDVRPPRSVDGTVPMTAAVFAKNRRAKASRLRVSLG